MKKYLHIFCAAVGLSVISCSINEESIVTDETSVKVPELAGDAVAGELLVKFDPQVSDILDRIMPVTKSGGPATRSGIVTVDDVLDLVGTYQVERVFLRIPGPNLQHVSPDFIFGM